MVALVGRRKEKLDQVQAEIQASGGIATTHSCDIREEEQVRAKVSAILSAHGRIDYLVDNAGGQFSAPQEKITAKGWDTVVRNNLTGGFLFARECYTQWMSRHTGDQIGPLSTLSPTCGTVCPVWAIPVRRGQVY